MSKERKTTKDDSLLPIIRSLVSLAEEENNIHYKIKDSHTTFEEIVDDAMKKHLDKRINMLPYPSGKATDCKSVHPQFESERELQWDVAELAQQAAVNR